VTAVKKSAKILVSHRFEHLNGNDPSKKVGRRPGFEGVLKAWIEISRRGARSSVLKKPSIKASPNPMFPPMITPREKIRTGE